jgi:hypothetical protein
MLKASRRVWTFAVICAATAGGLGLVFWRATTQRVMAPAQPALLTEQPMEVSPVEATIEQMTEAPVPAARPNVTWKRIYFRWTKVDEHYGKLAFVEQASVATPRFVDALSCEVAHVSAGRGLCLQAERGVFTRYQVTGFNREFVALFTVPLAGIPSRSRVSLDGKLAATTVFLTGHSYASVDFTTQTLILRLPSGEVLADLEQFRITKDGKRFQREDFNFWGVTFAPGGDRFYCTLSTNRRHYLMEGSLRSRSGEVVHENVECPSLSPDATRVAYKKRLPGNRATWQLHVLDLETRADTALSEKRNVDDQLEWLDNNRVLYALPHSAETPGPQMDVWMASANGSSKPTRFLEGAYSPAVER